MHRPASPLLHDYKPAPHSRPKKSRALQWFVVGLGIPLLGLALISTVDRTPTQAVPADAPEMTASAGAEVITEEPKVFSEVPLVLAPEPEHRRAMSARRTWMAWLAARAARTEASDHGSALSSAACTSLLLACSTLVICASRSVTSMTPCSARRRSCWLLS